MNTRYGLLRPIALTSAALLLASPVALAGAGIGASVGSARVDQGDFEGNDTSYKLYAGTSYREMIGGEIGYINFGQLGGSGPEARSWNLAVLLGIPTGWVTPYAKGGVAFADVEGSSVREEYKNEDPYYGVGVRFGNAASPLGVRIEYERFQLQEDVDMASVGAELRF